MIDKNQCSVKWFNDLNDDWKDAIKNSCREFKSLKSSGGIVNDDVISQLQDVEMLDLRHAKIKTLEPIKDFNKVIQIELSGCYDLANLEFIPKNIKYITIHWRTFESYEPLYKLEKLEKVYLSSSLEQKKLNAEIKKQRKKLNTTKNVA